MIDMEIEDAIIVGGAILTGVLACAIIGMVVAISRYVWGLV